MIKVTELIEIDEKDISYHFTRSGGPGGQNVNKVETGVELLFNLTTDSSLSFGVKNRLIKLAGKKVNSDGVLTINAQEFRQQERNREKAMEKLIELIKKASIRPKIRKETKPTRSSKEKRLTGKKIDSKKKGFRKKPEA